MKIHFRHSVCFCFFFTFSMHCLFGQPYPGFNHLPQHKHHSPERKRVELARGVYAFIGYGLSNFGVIASNNGYILIDVGSHPAQSKEALREIEQLTKDSLQAIILTHSHGDHRCGVEAFLEGRKTEVPIYAHVNFESEQHSVEDLKQITTLRSNKQFGSGIPQEMYPVNFIVPKFSHIEMGTPALPNHFVNEGKTELTIDGVKIELHTIPSETADHLAIWLPEKKVLFSGDAVYASFPNLYPIRGGTYRDVKLWAKGVRRLIEFKAEAIMFGHTDVVSEAPNIQSLLNNYASAIEYIYNETIAGMNEGKTPDQLAASIQLPMHLRKEPYLGEFYGSIPWAIREIYSAKLGWFDGNPTKLVPLTFIEEAERIAKLAGGKEQLVKLAERALHEKDYRWAARLADYLIELGEQTKSRLIKADALEEISKVILPVTGKNYLIQSAIDLRKN